MKNLYKALFNIKAELGCTIHAESNGQYGAYASLEQVLRTVDPIVRKHGLLIVQGPNVTDVGGPLLTTRIVHVEADEWIEYRHLLTPDKAGPQGLGACETYARRRTIMDIFGLAAENDDPDAAPQRTQPQRYSDKPKPTRAAGAVVKSGSSLMNKPIKIFKKYAGCTYGQIPLKELCDSRGWLLAQQEKEGKPMGPSAQEFCRDVGDLQNEHEMPPRDFAPTDETVPF
jgi:hypothetical protein